MASDSRHQSLWAFNPDFQYRRPLLDSTEADVCVIGAGVAGLTTAYLLAREGKSVVVLESDTIGSGMSGRTTAHLTNVLDDRFTRLERLRGLDASRQAAASHRAAIEHMARIVVREDLDCDFTYLDSYLIPGQDQSLEGLQAERWAAQRAGLEVRSVAEVPMEGFDWGPGVCFPYQAQFNVLKYLHGLAEACTRHYVRIYTHAHVNLVRCNKTCHAQVQNGNHVTAADLVVATNVPITGPLNLEAKQTAWMTFVVGALVPRGSLSAILLCDMEEPYHYVRIQSLDETHDVLLVGGEDRRCGQPADDDVLRYERLRHWTRQRFPQVVSFPYRWAGQIMETLDGLAFLGRNMSGHPNVYMISGDSGMGLTHGTIGGLLITDLIMGRDNPWTWLYDPMRIPLRAVPTILRQEAARAGDFLKQALSS